MLEDSFAGYRSLGWQLSVSITWLWLLPLMVSCFWGEAKHCLNTEQSLLVALRFFSLGHKSLMMSICVGFFGHFQWEAELFGYVVCLFFSSFGYFVLFSQPLLFVLIDSFYMPTGLWDAVHFSLSLCAQFWSALLFSLHTDWFFYVLSQSAVKLIQSFQFHLLHFPTKEPHFVFFLKSNSYLLINIHFYLFIIVIHFFKYTLFRYISNILFEVLFYLHLS